ncbi:MAG: hypothetical protein RLZ75_2259 [Pseudomonadota bacterium]|jgi:hypothetical protein
MYKIIKEYYAATAFTFIIIFYWVGKASERFLGINIPDVSFILILIFAVAGIFQMIITRRGLNVNELLFLILLISTPIFGNLAEIILNAQPSSAWIGYIDYKSLTVNNWSGFRSPILSSMIFIFSAKYLASCLNEKKFIVALFIGATPHFIWGIAQFLYMYIPFLLEYLPILVGGENQGNFNLNIVRATGLMTDPFAFSWFFYTVSLSLALISRSYRAAMVSMLISMMSISRSLMLSFAPLFLYFLTKYKKNSLLTFLGLIFFIAIYFGNEIQLIFDKRIEGDISFQSRYETNLLSLEEIVRGNFFGVGFSFGVYTDSTVATLLFTSGIPGLIFYFSAWFLFYRQFWIISGLQKEVLFFGLGFFINSFLVGTVEAQPGMLVIFVLYWLLKKRFLKLKLI